MKKFLIIALLISVVLTSMSLNAFAEGKVKRAASNTALGWTEIPKSIVKVTKDTDNPFMGITVGLLKGIANAFARTASGIGDVVTLPAGSKSDAKPAIKETMIDTPATK
ncbi:MAG: exosortase system-associated protein, TIGR04073 family [Candidatus Omnitrophota bacterium]